MIASLVSVTVIWLLMGNAANLAARIETEMSLGALLAIGLAVNAAADYLSLLETRWLLGRMPRAAWAQALVLIADLLVSALIIWAAIFLCLYSPLHGGEVESFAEILGLFSIFSVFFYSTFLTSVWTWAYIASTWLMRLAVRLRVAYWLDVEGKPVKVLFLLLSLCVGAVTFAGSLLLSGPLRSAEDGISPADRALCSVFRGRVCLDVAALTPQEQAQLDFILLACEGGVAEECLTRAFAIWESDAETTARLLRSACAGGNARGCNGLGVLYEKGLGVAADPAAAARLYRQGCDGGNALGCTNLGFLYEKGLGVAADLAEASRLYRQGCDGGSARGCNNFTAFYEMGIGVDKMDPVEALGLYRRGCALGSAQACAWADRVEGVLPE